MPNFSLVTRIHVLTAIREHDQRGAETFLAEQGIEEPSSLVLVERGRRYDPIALLAFAHTKATGTPTTADDVPVGSTRILTDLGFTVADPVELDAPKAAKRAAARVPGTRAPKAPSAPAKPVKAEPEYKLCPTCYTALPATGRCDFCD